MSALMSANDLDLDPNPPIERRSPIPGHFDISIVGAMLILLVWGPFWRSSVPAYAILSPDIVSDAAYTICWTGVVSPVVCTSGARVCC